MNLLFTLNRGKPNELPMIDGPGLRSKMQAGEGRLPELQLRWLEELESFAQKGRAADFIAAIKVMKPVPRCVRLDLPADKLASFQQKVRDKGGPVILGTAGAPTGDWEKALALRHRQKTGTASAAPVPETQPAPATVSSVRLMDLIVLAERASPAQLTAIQQLNTLLAEEDIAGFLAEIKKLGRNIPCIRVNLTGDALAIAQLQSRGQGGPVIIGPDDPVAVKWLEVPIKASWL